MLKFLNLFIALADICWCVFYMLNISYLPKNLTKILLTSHIFVTNIWRISHVLLTNTASQTTTNHFNLQPQDPGIQKKQKKICSTRQPLQFFFVYFADINFKMIYKQHKSIPIVQTQNVASQQNNFKQHQTNKHFKSLNF